MGVFLVVVVVVLFVFCFSFCCLFVMGCFGLFLFFVFLGDVCFFVIAEDNYFIKDGDPYDDTFF